jgi:hypothetical protein
MAKTPKRIRDDQAPVNPRAAEKTSSGRQFFVMPGKKTEQSFTTDYRMQLGGLPLETRAGFELIGYRLRKLLRNTPECWEEINREEHGSFWSIFRKYHLPLLFPFYFFFTLRELIHYNSLALFLRHTAVALPLFTGLYAAYIFILGIIAEETAELSGGRFSPQSGMRVALFSSLILSFLSIAAFLPVAGMPLIALGIFWHYRQLFCGARTLLNISDVQYKIYRLSHILVWIFLGLSGFVILSIISFLSAKLGLAAI